VFKYHCWNATIANMSWQYRVYLFGHLGVSFRSGFSFGYTVCSVFRVILKKQFLFSAKLGYLWKWFHRLRCYLFRLLFVCNTFYLLYYYTTKIIVSVFRLWSLTNLFDLFRMQTLYYNSLTRIIHILSIATYIETILISCIFNQKIENTYYNIIYHYYLFVLLFITIEQNKLIYS